MSSFARTAFGLTLGAALLVGQTTTLPVVGAAPAEARERCGYDRDGRYRCRDGGIDVEDIVVGAAVLAGIAVVANEVLKGAKDEWDRGRGWGYGDRRDARSAAVDACARTAEDEARRYGADARVRDIDDVDRDGSRYRVRGTVEVERGGWGDDRWGDRDRRDIDRARFTCTAQDGRVTAFRFTDGFDYAYRY